MWNRRLRAADPSEVGRPQGASADAPRPRRSPPAARGQGHGYRLLRGPDERASLQRRRLGSRPAGVTAREDRGARSSKRNRRARNSVKGVFPVPPNVRFPTEMTAEAERGIEPPRDVQARAQGQRPCRRGGRAARGASWRDLARPKGPAQARDTAVGGRPAARAAGGDEADAFRHEACGLLLRVEGGGHRGPERWRRPEPGQQAEGFAPGGGLAEIIQLRPGDRGKTRGPGPRWGLRAAVGIRLPR